MTSSPTQAQYGAYNLAFDHFNRELFAGKLAPCLLNFSRKARTNGFFSADRWSSRDGRDTTHEISLNPDLLAREPVAIMGTLVHEMVHLWQQEFGSPSRSTYHNVEWANRMEKVGLMPSNTGQPGGKRTGQRMTRGSDRLKVYRQATHRSATFRPMMGQELRKAPQRAGLTQERLSFLAGLSRPYISQLERDLKSPTVDTLFRICDALRSRRRTSSGGWMPRGSGSRGRSRFEWNSKGLARRRSGDVPTRPAR